MNNVEFLKLYPQAKLNISNSKISLILESFVLKYESKFGRSWQSVGKLMRDHVREDGIVFQSCNDMKQEYWSSRGWDNPAEKVSAIVSTQLSNTSPKYWESKGYSENEAKEKASNFYRDKLKGKRLLPTQLAYYTSKGMSEDDAKEALTNEQTKRITKLIEKETANPELRHRRLWNQIEYWLNKGYTNEQGIQLMREQFESRNLQTMKKLVNSYIEKGLSESEAIEKAQKDYKKRASKTMQTRIKNNSFGFQKASQLSLNFFKPLMDKLDTEKIEY